MEVHLITRVNLKYDEKFVFTEKRHNLLMGKVAIAVYCQTYTDFKWIGLVDGDTEERQMNDFKNIFDEVYP